MAVRSGSVSEQVATALVGGAAALCVAWVSSWAQHGGRRRRRRREIVEEIDLLGRLDPWPDKRERAHRHVDRLLDRHLPRDSSDDDLSKATTRGVAITLLVSLLVAAVLVWLLPPLSFWEAIVTGVGVGALVNSLDAFRRAVVRRGKAD